MRIPIVGVMGSGSRSWESRAEPLGRWLASAGYHLLTGGGQGVMAAVCRAFFETSDRAGLVLGVLPAGHGEDLRPPEGYPNRWVDVPIRTHLPLSGEQGDDLASRNHINVLTSDVIVSLPGSAGTRSEIELALRYGRPVVAWLERADEMVGCPQGVRRVADLESVREFVRAQLAKLAQGNDGYHFQS